MRSWTCGLALLAAACGPGSQPYYNGRLLGPFQAPQTVTVEVVSTTQARVSWDDPSQGFGGFRVERTTASEENWKQVAELAPGETNVLDDGLSPTEMFLYRVIVTSDEGDSPPSATVTVDPSGGPALKPGAPADVVARSLSDFALEVTWGVAEDRSGKGIAAYRVFLNDVLVLETTEFKRQDGNLATGVQYCYSIAAVDGEGREGDHSAPACAAPGQVDAVPGAPVVTMSAPAAGATFEAPATIPLAADASDTDGVAKVEFYNGSTLIGEDTTAPYTFSWTNVAEGTYSVFARATDTQGNTAQSGNVSITVGPVNNNPRVTGLSLFNGDNDQVVPGFDPIPAGATIDLSDLNIQNYAIRANTEGTPIGSVRFNGNDLNLPNNVRTENNAPYSLFSDNNGDLTGQPLSAGMKSITTTVFSAANGGGNVLSTRTFTFQVVE